MADLNDLLTRREELAKQLGEIDQQIAETRQAERKSAIRKVQDLMAAHGLTVADLGGFDQVKTISKATGKGSRPVAAKYRDAATGETWSGRGLKPRWLRAALEGGKTLDEFLIKTD